MMYLVQQMKPSLCLELFQASYNVFYMPNNSRKLEK